MSTEIERKYLVVNDNYKRENFQANHIVQGYICRETGKTVRIRISDEKGFITIKGPSTDNGLSRFEWEKEISLKEASELMKLCSDGVIDKTRYKVRSGRHIVEIDEFAGNNRGLVMAEIELESNDDIAILPDFIGKEVTGDKRYYNSNLLVNPFSNWKER